MEAIFDRNGDAIGWLDDNILYDTNDHYRAVVVGDDIFQLGSNRFLGKLQRGIIWDRNGMAVACLRGAEPPPTLPDLPPSPPPAPLERPLGVAVEARPAAQLNLSDRWSQRTWVRFLDGQ